MSKFAFLMTFSLVLMIISGQRVSKAEEFHKIKYYVKPVQFYNGSNSNSLTEVIKKIFSQQNKYIECCVDTQEVADYMLIPTVPKVQIKNQGKNRVIQVEMSLVEKHTKSNVSVAQSKQAINIIKDKTEDQKIAKQMLEKGFTEISNYIYNRMIQRLELYQNEEAKKNPEADDKNDENVQ